MSEPKEVSGKEELKPKDCWTDAEAIVSFCGFHMRPLLSCELAKLKEQLSAKEKELESKPKVMRHGPPFSACHSDQEYKALESKLRVLREAFEKLETQYQQVLAGNLKMQKENDRLRKELSFSDDRGSALENAKNRIRNRLMDVANQRDAYRDIAILERVERTHSHDGVLYIGQEIDREMVQTIKSGRITNKSKDVKE